MHFLLNEAAIIFSKHIIIMLCTKNDGLRRGWNHEGTIVHGQTNI